MPLSLPDSPRKIVFRTLVDLFQKDPVLQRTIRPGSWFVWDGPPTSINPFEAAGLMPAVRLTPLGLNASPQTQTQQNSPMAVQLEVATSGFNVDDVLDLWSCFERAIFLGDGGRTLESIFRTALADSPDCAGANYRNLHLGMPAVTPSQADAQDGFMIATGTIMIEMLIRR